MSYRIILILAIFCLVNACATTNVDHPTNEDLHQLGESYLFGRGVTLNVKKAAYYLEQSASNGYAPSQFSIGWMHLKGDHYEKNHSHAAEWFHKAALQDYAQAQYFLGARYKNGEGRPKDYRQAAYWYEKAAEKGLPRAQNDLGSLYQQGLGVEQNYDQAHKWYVLAADSKLAHAMNNLGQLHQGGLGVPKDYDKARRWFELAADREHSAAMYSLGVFYEHGYGVERNNLLARNWYQKSHQHGEALGAQALGVLSLNGIGTKKSAKEAFTYFLHAANAGLADSQYQIALYYIDSRLDTEKNHEKMIYWLKKAAKNGHTDAKMDLGSAYHQGHGVEKNLSSSTSWFQSATEDDHIPAYFFLGLVYEQQQNYSQSRVTFIAGSELDCVRCQYKLGRSFLTYPSVYRNTNKAEYWLLKSAKRSYLPAIDLLVAYYSSDTYGKKNLQKAVSWTKIAAPRSKRDYYAVLGAIEEENQDYKKALDWYQLGVKKGGGQSQYRLGLLHQHGNGVPTNPELASTWILSAANQGELKAQLWLAKRGLKNKNYESAEKWFLLMARQKSPLAQYNLGWMYLTQDKNKKALHWLKLAADNGQPNAIHVLDNLTSYQ